MGPAVKCTASSGTGVKPYGGRTRYYRYISKPGVLSPSHGDIEFPALTLTPTLRPEPYIKDLEHKLLIVEVVLDCRLRSLHSTL